MADLHLSKCKVHAQGIVVFKNVNSFMFWLEHFIMQMTCKCSSLKGLKQMLLAISETLGGWNVLRCKLFKRFFISNSMDFGIICIINKVGHMDFQEVKFEGISS